MEISEVHPLFLYASSQNEFTHQNLHDPGSLSGPTRPHTHKNNHPKPQYIHPQPQTHLNTPNQQRGKPINVPQLSYGFQPKPSNRYANQHPQSQKKVPSSQHNDQSRTRPLQQHVYQPPKRITQQQRNRQFSQNFQVQESVQKNRQNIDPHSSRNLHGGQGNSHRQFTVHSQHQQKLTQPPTNHRRPSKNGHSYRPANDHNRDRKFGSQNHHRDEHRQESIQQRKTFADMLQTSKIRNANDHSEYSLLPPNDNNRPSFSNLNNQNHRKNNERMNMHHHGRSMRIENRPQLPPRPPFLNSGVKINTAAGELPILNLDSFDNVNENPSIHLRNNDHPQPSTADDSGKKTYLLFKAPTAATTESPTFVFENLHHSPSYILNGLTETTVQLPDIFSTAEPFTLPDNGEAPIVLDLVQIPDHSLFSHQEKHDAKPVPRPDFRKEKNDAHHYNSEHIPQPAFRLGDERKSDQHYEPEPHSSIREVDHKDRPQVYQHEDIQHQTFRSPDQYHKNSAQLYQTEPTSPDYPDPPFRPSDHTEKNEIQHYNTDPIPSPGTTPANHREPKYIRYFTPTESYPTTYDDDLYPSSPVYTEQQEETPKPQQKMIPKPKLKEQQASLNFSLHHPISYSSSVSIVSVKQSTDAKPKTAKKQKQTFKKVLSAKKKVKIPENGDYINDDHYGDQSVPGEAGLDYPIYKDIPTTSFECRKFKAPGFYADLETGCQVFHNCDTSMAKHSFMCPNGTIFHQELFICDWWYNVKCDDSKEFYSLNSGLYTGAHVDDDFEKKA